MWWLKANSPPAADGRIPMQEDPACSWQIAAWKRLMPSTDVSIHLGLNWQRWRLDGQGPFQEMGHFQKVGFLERPAQ